MGIFIPSDKKEELQRCALDLAEQAVADYRKPGSHVLGWDATCIDIADGAEVEIIAICFDRRRLKDLNSEVLDDVHEVLEEEA